MSDRLAIILLLAVAAVALALGITIARAQERFPRSCCGEYDCLRKPVPRTDIERRDGGWWLIKERMLIPFDQVRASPDTGVYICRTQMGHGALIVPKGEKPCLFMPEVDG